MLLEKVHVILSKLKSLNFLIVILVSFFILNFSIYGDTKFIRGFKLLGPLYEDQNSDIIYISDQKYDDGEVIKDSFKFSYAYPEDDWWENYCYLVYKDNDEDGKFNGVVDVFGLVGNKPSIVLKDEIAKSPDEVISLVSVDGSIWYNRKLRNRGRNHSASLSLADFNKQNNKDNISIIFATYKCTRDSELNYISDYGFCYQILFDGESELKPIPKMIYDYKPPVISNVSFYDLEGHNDNSIDRVYATNKNMKLQWTAEDSYVPVVDFTVQYKTIGSTNWNSLNTIEDFITGLCKVTCGCAINLDNLPDIVDAGGAEFKITAFDYFGNKSSSITDVMYIDKTWPIISEENHNNNYSISGNPHDLRFKTNRYFTVVDNESGIINVQCTLDYEDVQLSDVVYEPTEVNGNKYKFTYDNLVPNKTFKLKIEAIDNYGNDSVYITNVFGVPTVPYISSSTLSWNGEKFILSGNILSSDKGEELIDRLSLRSKNSQNIIYTFPKDDDGHFTNDSFSIPISFDISSYLHGFFEFDLATTVNSINKTFIDSYQTDGPIPNRTPDKNSDNISSLIFNNTDKDLIYYSIDNNPDLYSTRWQLSNEGVKAKYLSLGTELFQDMFINPDSLCFEAFHDLDGDEVNFTLVSDWQGNETEPFALGIITETNESDFSKSYLLPLRFYMDTTSPQFSDVLIEGDDLYVSNQQPESITLKGVQENLSGIRQIHCSLFCDNISLEEAVITTNIALNENNISFPWPFSHSFPETVEKEFTLRCSIMDGVGLYSNPRETAFIIDRNIPDISQLDRTISVDSNKLIYAIYDLVDNSISIDYSRSIDVSDHFGLNSCLISPNFSYDENSDIQSVTQIVNEDTIKIILSENYIANNAIPLNLLFKDESGNEISDTFFVYTPAEVILDDIRVLRTISQKYSAFDSSKGIHLFLERNPEKNLVNWSSLEIQRRSRDGVWFNPFSDRLNPKYGYSDRTVDSHGEYQYKLAPVNASGYVNTEGSLIIPDDESNNLYYKVGNYIPLTEIVENSYTSRLGKAFMGPLPSISFSYESYDRDGDTLATRFIVRNENTDTIISEANGSGPLLVISLPGEEKHFTVSGGDFDFTDGVDYQLVLRTEDRWTEEGNPDAVPGDAFEVIQDIQYDSSGPELVHDYMIVNDRRKEWGMTQLKAKARDLGVGLKKIWAVFTGTDGANKLLDDSSVTVGDDGSTDDKEYTFEIPEGLGAISLFGSDRLGNESTLSSDILVQNDETAPLWKSLSLDDTSASGTFISGTPNVRVKLEIEDDLSGLDSYTFEYIPSDDSDPIIITKKINNHEALSHVLTCAPNRGDIVEGIEYGLSLTLYDQGGNASLKRVLDKKILFDLTSPELTFNSWDLEKFGDFYVSNISTVAFPNLTIDNDSEESVSLVYELIDENGNVVEQSGKIHFDIQGYYRLRIIVVDMAGLESEMELPVLYDNQAPTDILLDGLCNNNGYQPLQTAAISLAATDNYSDVKEFDLKISEGTTILFQDELTSSDALSYALIIPETEADTLSLSITATDGAGNVSAPMEKSFSVAPSTNLLAIEAPLYIGERKSLSLFWDYLGDDEISHYKVELFGNSGFSDSPIVTREVPTEYITISESEMGNLSGCEWLYLRIQPINSDGLSLAATVSHRITVDLEKPVIERIVFPQMIRPDNLTVEWSVSDDSPLKPIQVSLEEVRTENGNVTFDSLGWFELTNTKMTESRDISELLSNLDQDIPAEALRIRILAMDRAGNFSDRVSGLIPIDYTPAPSYEILDQGDYINPKKNDLTFQWTWAQIDPESGEEGYYYQLSANGSIAPDGWSYTTSREVTFHKDEYSYTEGVELFLLVKRDTITGQESIMYSNGIIPDTSAPVITEVLLTTDEEGNNELNDLYYTGDRDIYLKVDAEEIESVVTSYSARAGFHDIATFSPLEQFSSHTSNILRKILPVPEEDEKNRAISYEVQAYNGVALASLPSYSRGILFNPTSPILDDVLFTYEDGTAYVTWSVAHTLPLEQQIISIHRENGAVISSRILDEEKDGKRTLSLEGLSLGDGKYYASVKIIDKAEKVKVQNSPMLTLDKTVPTIVNLNYDKFVYDRLRAEFSSNEPLSEIRLEMTSGGETLLEEGRVFSSPVSSWRYEFDLMTLPLWAEMQTWGSRFITLRISAKDMMGNWCDWKECQIVFDNSGPSAPVVSRDNSLMWGATSVTMEQPLVGDQVKVEDIYLTSQDNDSPIVGYQWAVVSSNQNEPSESEWSPLRNLGEDSHILNTGAVRLDGLFLSDNQAFHLAVRTRNKAGLYSPTGYSELLIADLKAPEFILSSSEHLTVDNDGDEPVYVYQGEGQISVELIDETCPYVIQTLTILDPVNQIAYENETGLDRAEGPNYVSAFKFDPTVTGVHRLQITLEDLFGRKETKSLLIRSNPPPLLQIPENLTARPGEPFALSYQSWVTSLESIVDIRVEGSSLSAPLSAGWDEDIILPGMVHSEPDGQETVFAYTITYTDQLGISASGTFNVTLRNSSEGTLLVDEVWSGTHYLTGVVTIPEGRSLTIMPGTRVLSQAGDIFGHDQALILESGGILAVGVGAEFDSAFDGESWAGITAQNGLTLEGVSISHAQRGLVLLPGSYTVSLKDCTFSDNTVGVHALNDAVWMENSAFENNLHYGVKEDNGVNPVMIGNFFRNNGFDYYDIDLAAIGASLIDTLNTDNAGNTGE